MKLLLLIFALLLAACSGMSDIDRALLNQAQTYHQSGDYRKEAAIYHELLTDNPGNMDYIYKYAESARMSGQGDMAVRYYDKFLRANPASLDAEEGKALALMGDGKYDEAAQIFAGILQKDATRWKTINALGLISAAKGHIDQAMEYYGMALEVSPDNPNILNNMGLSYALNGDYQNAAMVLTKASGIAGEDTDKKRKIDMNLSLVYGLAGKTADAQKVLKTYLPEDGVNQYLAIYSRLRADRKTAVPYLKHALTGR